MALNPERIQEIFSLALQKKSPADRASYLAEACQGDLELRHQIESMLRAKEQADEFFGQTVQAPPANFVTERAGTIIGRYKLLEQIGEGGFGVVYVAEQEVPVRRRVALKVIKMGMDTKQVIARFEAERQALALMDHPNIAKVLDAGATDSGRPYFVMELVKGERITDYCDKDNLSTRERLDLFVQICHAIQHAHQKGIIHRDIKPSNILVTMHDGVPVPKVIDFGIAKATEQRLTDKTVYTALEQMIGTPAYMSPEQAEMSGIDIDTRSDIYSLGVLLYELLTGKTPFDPKELVASGLEAMRRTIREQEPQRPSTRLTTMVEGELTATAKRRQTDPPKLVHSVRGDLDWIVMKCLEKNRTRRYETANGLASDIERHLNNEAVVARPPSQLYRFQKVVQRNKLVCAAAAAVACALLLGVVVSAWQAWRAVRAERVATGALQHEAALRQKAEAAETQVKQRLAESEAISKFLTDVFQSPDPYRAGHTTTVAEMLGAAARNLETNQAIPPARRVKLQTTLGLTYRALGLYREAIPLQEKVRDYYLAASGQEHPETLNEMDDLAYSYSDAGRRDEALKLGEKVLALRRKVLGPEHPDTLWTMINLAYYYRMVGRPNEAIKLGEEVLALRRKVLGPENPDTLWTMRDLAYSYSHAGRPNEAIKLGEDVLALRRKALGPEHTDTIEAMADLANSYATAGREDEALKLREEVLPLRRKVLGPEDPGTLNALADLGGSYAATGRRDEALKLREELLVLRRKLLGLEHPDTLWAMEQLEYSYRAVDRRDEALKLGEEVLALRRKVSGPEHPDTLVVMAGLATSYHVAGRLDEALKLREEVLALRRKVLGLEHPDTLDAMNKLAISYDESNRRDEALKLREEVLALYRKVLGPEHPNTLSVMHGLANSYDNSGHRDEALKLREEALALSRKVLGPENRNTLLAMRNLANSYDDVGRLGEALKLREEVLTLRRKVLGPEHPDTLDAMNRLAISYDEANRRDEAIKIREESQAIQLKANSPENSNVPTVCQPIIFAAHAVVFLSALFASNLSP